MNLYAKFIYANNMQIICFNMQYKHARNMHNCASKTYA